MAKNEETSVKNTKEWLVPESDLDNLAYSLIESSSDKFVDDDFIMPTIDMNDLHSGGKKRNEFINKFGKAMEDIGQVILINHGLEGAIEAAHEGALQIMTSVPIDRKMDFIAEDVTFGEPLIMGYIPIQESTENLPNSVEVWEWGRPAFKVAGENIERAKDFWPNEEDFEAKFRSYWQGCEYLEKPLIHALFEYLSVDPTSLDDRLSPSNSCFRINHYPPTEELQISEDTVGRILAHEDYGLFTFLPATEVEGLQTFYPGLNSWIRMNPPKGSIIINGGDWLRFVSNGQFESATHRVCVPRNAGKRACRRITVPYVMHPHEDAIIEVAPGLEPKYKPCTGKEFMNRLFERYKKR